MKRINVNEIVKVNGEDIRIKFCNQSVDKFHNKPSIVAATHKIGKTGNIAFSKKDENSDSTGSNCGTWQRTATESRMGKGILAID